MFGQDDAIYRGGFARLMRRLDRTTFPLNGAAARLPALDVDLAEWHRRTVPKAVGVVDDLPRFDVARKWLELQYEFEGQSQLFWLHAVLIALSRRRDPPPDALPLFFRIWAEQGQLMARDLPVRWLISSATTFADCGTNADQRALGMGLSLLFDLIKLHESERRGSGLAGDQRTEMVPTSARAPIAFDMSPYSLTNGDLDKVMLARLWRLAERDPVIQPLATRMLQMVMTDQRTVFARIRAGRPPKARK
ncbi:MAG: hypothetical protein AAF601_02815 [Pseudomonadota bacterium]